MSIRMGRKRKTKQGIVYVSNDRRTRVYIQPMQPKPTFFSDADLKRMSKTPGSYQYGEGVRK